jgi:hypothetical protein
MNDTLLQRLARWLDKSPRNTLAKLAVALGYASTNTITQWFCRQKIPSNRVEQLEQFLKKNGG